MRPAGDPTSRRCRRAIAALRTPRAPGRLRGPVMNALRPIDRLFARTLAIPSTPYLVVLVPTIIGTFRLAEEALGNPGLVSPDAPRSPATQALLAVTFYALMQLALAASIGLASRRPSAEILGPVSVGLILGWLPPVIDWLLVTPSDQRFFSFFWRLDLDLFAPYQSIGESITLWLLVVLSGAFAWWLTRRLFRGVLGALGAYLVVQLVGWGWPALAILVAPAGPPPTSTGGVTAAAVGPMMLLGLLAVFGLLVAQRSRFLLPSLARVNHALPWGFVTVAAARMGGETWFIAGVRGVVMAFAFQLAAIANDFLDREQDGSAGGSARPASRDDLVISTYLQAALLVWTVCFHPAGFFSLLLFFALVALYQLPPLRLKRLFCGSYRTEGLCGGACVLFGSPPASEGRWLGVAMLLAIGGFSVGSWFKDYKDIEQDRASSVGTIYTRQMKRGRSLHGIHAFVRSVLFAALLVPPLWLGFAHDSWTGAAGLFAIAALISARLLTLGHRKRAVESSLWALSAYLALFALLVPQLSTTPPHEPGPPRSEAGAKRPAGPR